MDDLPSKYRYEKRTYWRFGDWTHRWAVEGATMAMEFQARRYSDGKGGHGWTAGIELHSTSGEGAPSHGRCWCLSDRACWHNGSSMMGAEWHEWWQSSGATDEQVFWRLASCLAEREAEEVARG